MHDKLDEESENDIGWEESDQDYWEQSPSGKTEEIFGNRQYLKHGMNWGKYIWIFTGLFSTFNTNAYSSIYSCTFT